MKKLPLHIQLTIIVLSITLVMGAFFALSVVWSNQTYHNEVTQQLHKNLASYIIEHQRQPLIHDGKINTNGLKQMATDAMAINPLVEIYLIDTDGNVLGHALQVDLASLHQVDIEPIKKLLNGRTELTYGDNPRIQGEKRVFSAAEVVDGGKTVGYLYVVLNSSISQSIMQQLKTSYVTKLILGLCISVVLLSLAISTFYFRKLTYPLRQLTKEMEAFKTSQWMPQSASINHDTSGHKQSELIRLQDSYVSMRSQIVTQFQNLEEASRLKRELISNISHDLRTPLASLQGYIEMLLLKQDVLSADVQHNYLATAHRNSIRLSRLVSDLFELSKLEAGQIAVEMESFSLLELIYDVVQDYELESKKQEISIQVHAKEHAYYVVGDIALIQRVLQNLIDNAMRFTPQGGRIDIKLNESEKQVNIDIMDTGFGIDEKDLPHIFDAYYSTHNNPDSEAQDKRKEGTGLGLAIVKKILELHNAHIFVDTVPNKSTCFSFKLGTL